jgi:hypothetical protein
VELCHDQTDPDGTQVGNDKLAGQLELIEIRHTFDAVFSSALSTSDTGDRAARGRLALFRQFGNTRLDARIAEQPTATSSIPLKTAAHEGMVKVSLNGAYANGQLIGKVRSGKRNVAAAGKRCSGHWEATKE